MPTDRLIRTHEMARKLSCSQETIRRQAREKIIPSVKVGTDYRFDAEKVILSLSQTPQK